MYSDPGKYSVFEEGIIPEFKEISLTKVANSAASTLGKKFG